MLGSQWSKDELECFYSAIQPLDGSNSDQESNDSSKASTRPQKRGCSEFQSVFKTSDTDYTDLLQPQPASSSYRCLSVSKKKRSGDESSALDALHTLADLSVNILPPSPVVESGSAIMYIRRDPRQRRAVRGRHSTDTGATGAEDSRVVHRPRRLAAKWLASQDLPRGTLHINEEAELPGTSRDDETEEEVKEDEPLECPHGKRNAPRQHESSSSQQAPIQHPVMPQMRKPSAPGHKTQGNYMGAGMTPRQHKSRSSHQAPIQHPVMLKMSINVPKTKGNRSGEPFQHRFSVHRIRELKFNEDQIEWINDAGFGALLAMSEISLPVKLVAWVMKNINPELREFRIKNKAIVFDKQLVCNILGVPSGEEPLKLSCTTDEYEAFQQIREPFMGGVRGPLTKCKDILSKAKDKTTFMRAFVLLALGSVLCPGTDNAITAKYLHSLKDVSQIKSFDWAGHILDVFMAEVRKYHACLSKDEAKGVSSSPYLGSCLIIPAIAYMDYLDIAADRATHKINYSVPGICHVSNKDFDFVEMVDRNKLQLIAFGQRPFRTTSPYPTLVPMSGYIPLWPPMPEEEAVAPSPEDWLDPPGTSSHPPVHTTSASIESLPQEYQVLLAEHNSLVEKDIDELLQSMKEQTKQIMAKRGAELAYKMSRLNTKKDVADLATK